MEAVHFDNVKYTYRDDDSTFAVNGVTLTIREGEFVAILGRNGSGKSTLAKLINALLEPVSGRVTVFGMDTLDEKNTFEIRKSAGMVFQNPDNQTVASIVEDDVAFGPENIGVPREEIGRRIDFALKAVGMEKFRHATPSRLSGGQKQRIAIAGVLAILPKIMILDESTAMLDPKGRREVMDVVRRLNKEQGMTVILITHFMDEALQAEVLEKLRLLYPIVNEILEYRQYAKLKSTYADGLAVFIHEDDHRIHGKFNQTVTATGRISSTEPNLQNIPARVELGRLIRKVFVPEEGYVFVDADYSQIELRVLAHCSGDAALIEAYREAKDIHRITASQVFHTPFDEVTDLQRRNAKAVNFGIVYGISSFGLSQDLSITRKEAAEYIDRYFETYPGIKKFLDDAVAHAKEQGYVVTLFGRRRPVPELSSSNFMQRQFGERVAMNSPIQGTAADIMKIAMIAVDRELRTKSFA